MVHLTKTSILKKSRPRCCLKMFFFFNSFGLILFLRSPLSLSELKPRKLNGLCISMRCHVTEWRVYRGKPHQYVVGLPGDLTTAWILNAMNKWRCWKPSSETWLYVDMITLCGRCMSMMPNSCSASSQQCPGSPGSGAAAILKKPV